MIPAGAGPFPQFAGLPWRHYGIGSYPVSRLAVVNSLRQPSDHGLDFANYRLGHRYLGVFCQCPYGFHYPL